MNIFSPYFLKVLFSERLSSSKYVYIFVSFIDLILEYNFYFVHKLVKIQFGCEQSLHAPIEKSK